MSLLSSIFAIGWEPELRGLLTVIIAVVVLPGSIYMILATNMGARLGFLVSLAALAGWMGMMGLIWMIYGIGLQGPLPSWQEMPGRTVIQEASALTSAGILENPIDVDPDAPANEQAEAVAAALEAEGWHSLDAASSEYGQAYAAAQTFITETDALPEGGYAATAVFDIGGERWPKLGDSLDFLAFKHDPRYALVEVAPYVQTRTESGRAPASSVIDETQPRQYVYMVRDLGARRQPALVLFIGGTLIFLSLCYLLHRRDATVKRNLAQPVPAS